MRRNPWIGAVVLAASAAMLGGMGTDVEARGSVTVTFTTNPVPAPNNVYNPFNVLAVWIESGGTFVKTAARWSAARTQHLVAWRAKAGVNDVDAVVGASRLTDNTAETISWNLKNKLNTLVPDGTFTIRLEMGQNNSTTPAQNNQGTFTFVKGPTAQVQTALANGGFTNVTINYDPNAAACGDMIVDVPEKCEVGSATTPCPTTCPAPADACMPTVLVGTAAMCTAECQVQAITACTGGDGCCAAGCTTATDSDCVAGSGGGGNNNGGDDNAITGGCAAGGDSSSGGALAAFGLLGAAVLFRRRRR